MLLRRFYDEGLAQASYLIGCQVTGEALVVDANRDIEQYIAVAQAEGFRIVHVTETHIHADFVSGSRELAQRTGATLYLSDEGGPDWQYSYAAEAGAVLLKDGSRLKVGKVNVDENPEVSRAYGIQSIPTLMLFKNGQVAERVVGALPKPMLEKALKPHLAAAPAAS